MKRTLLPTTKEFLDDLNMKNLSDLPDLPESVETKDVSMEDQSMSQAI